MKLVEIHIKSYKGLSDLKFNFSVPSNSLCALGEVGSGKSTAMEAVYYALTGYTHGKQKGCNIYTGEKPDVEVVVLNEEDATRITFSNGKVVNKKALSIGKQREFQNLSDGQSFFKYDDLFTQLSSTDKRKTLEAVLDIDYKGIKDRVVAKIKSLKGDIASLQSISELSTEDLSKTIFNLRTSLDDANKLEADYRVLFGYKGVETLTMRGLASLKEQYETQREEAENITCPNCSHVLLEATQEPLNNKQQTFLSEYETLVDKMEEYTTLKARIKSLVSEIDTNERLLKSLKNINLNEIGDKQKQVALLEKLNKVLVPTAIGTYLTSIAGSVLNTAFKKWCPISSISIENGDINVRRSGSLIPTSELSRGERQQVNVSMALALRMPEEIPPVIFFDEFFDQCSDEYTARLLSAIPPTTIMLFTTHNKSGLFNNFKTKYIML